MITIRKSADRGHANHGWLDTYHTFSFADYYDPAFMGFGVLRVINEDRVAGGAGFPTHGHRDMEIVTYIIDGALEHKDSMGNAAVIRPGEVQRMSAGTGVRHSEFNPSADAMTHLLQIWILPNEEGLKPGYGQKDFSSRLREGKMVLVASGDGREGSVSMNQDLDLYALRSSTPGAHTFALRPNRSVWLQVVRGEVNINGEDLAPGDGAAINRVDGLVLNWQANSEFLLFDMP